MTVLAFIMGNVTTIAVIMGLVLIGAAVWLNLTEKRPASTTQKADLPTKKPGLISEGDQLEFESKAKSIALQFTVVSVFLGLVTAVYMIVPTLTSAFLGVLSGLVIVLTLIALASPLYIGAGTLVNKPNAEPGVPSRSGFHLFTFVENGEIKIIVRGEKVVRMIMDTAGKRFAEKGSAQGSPYWEVVETKEGEDDENPIERVIWFLRPWAWYVFKTTGAVFTGIYPFQKVREYSFERTNLSRSEKAGSEKSNLKLAVKEDISDHYRHRMFLYPMHITGAETRDKIPLDIIGTAKLMVVNPHLAAFGTNRWDHLVVNRITDAINTVTKALNVDAILTYEASTGAISSEEEERLRRPINDAVMRIKDDTKDFGIEILGFDVSEANPDLPEQELAQLRAEAIAFQASKATRIDGKARAGVLTDLNEANAAGGEHALASLQGEALVRAARAAGEGGGTVILMPGSGNVDPTQTAILAELKRANREN
ncbi:hypothetical protein K2Q16_04525 [Patescibacteria group bacterium]|nr:hypothetical protein [Patescibacteria group bacterium]